MGSHCSLPYWYPCVKGESLTHPICPSFTKGSSGEWSKGELKADLSWPQDVALIHEANVKDIIVVTQLRDLSDLKLAPKLNLTLDAAYYSDTFSHWSAVEESDYT